MFKKEVTSLNSGEVCRKYAKSVFQMKFSLASPLSARIRSLETNLERGLRKLVASKHVRFKQVDGISQSSLLE